MKNGSFEVLSLISQPFSAAPLNGYDGTTALHMAAEDCNFDMVRCLIENGANVNVRDKYGKTPLGLVTPGEDIAEHLISCGAHI